MAIQYRGPQRSGGMSSGIARALRHNPPVVLIDEAIKASDMQTEQTIDAPAGDKTVLVVVHCMASLQFSGRIVEITPNKSI